MGGFKLTVDDEGRIFESGRLTGFCSVEIIDKILNPVPSVLAEWVEASRRQQQDAIKYAKALVLGTHQAWVVWRAPYGWICVPKHQTDALDNQESIIILEPWAVLKSCERAERRLLAAKIKNDRAAIIYGISKHKKRGSKELFEYFAWLKKNGRCYKKLPG